MENINQFIFSRTQPSKKVETIKNLSDTDILRVNQSTVARMIKEAGIRRGNQRCWDLRLSSENRRGNNWNSTAESICICRDEIFLDLYVQLDSTDTTTVERYVKFFGHGDYRGQVKGFDGRNDRYYYFTYNTHDQANVLKGIILQYLQVKYAEKLTPKAA